jgi:hypothetical protein
MLQFLFCSPVKYLILLGAYEYETHINNQRKDANGKNIYIGQAYVKNEGIMALQITPGVRQVLLYVLELEFKNVQSITVRSIFSATKFLWWWLCNQIYTQATLSRVFYRFQRLFSRIMFCERKVYVKYS